MVPMGSPSMPVYSSYTSMPNLIQGPRGIQPVQNMQTHSNPSTSNPSAYNSPRNHAIQMANPSGVNMQNYGSNHANSAPPGTNHQNAQVPSNQHPNGETQQLAHPIPHVPNPASSIAKWGTPASLPPKPPPPQDMNPQKFIEINRGLPPHAQISGLSRAAFTGSPGMGDGGMGGFNGVGGGGGK